jgi:hypothetical protein
MPRLAVHLQVDSSGRRSTLLSEGPNGTQSLLFTTLMINLYLAFLSFFSHSILSPLLFGMIFQINTVLKSFS